MESGKMFCEILNSDARSIPLADESVQCCITSPPYWGLRDYQVDGQLGDEPTPEEYIDNMVSVFREVHRVLKPNGTLWLNLGDSYAGSGGAGGDYNPGGLKDGQPRYDGTAKLVRSKRIPRGSGRWGGGDSKVKNLPAKNLVGIPWRVALALQADGWWLRQDIIWHKPNPMPESVRDRCTKSHEYVFLLSKKAHYYYDNESISEKSSYLRGSVNKHPYKVDGERPGENSNLWGALHKIGARKTRNKRSVWKVNTKPYKGAHFATFPPKLVEPMILAGSAVGDIVFDPFAGTATVGAVCLKHKRNFIGLELNMEYIDLAIERTSNVQIALL